jgi:hypothetical protein
MSESTPTIKECTIGSYWQGPGLQNDEINLHIQLKIKFNKSNTETVNFNLPSAWYNEWDSITPTPIPIKGLSDIQMDNIYKEKKTPTELLQKALDSLKEKTTTKTRLQEALDNLNYIKDNLL